MIRLAFLILLLASSSCVAPRSAGAPQRARAAAEAPSELLPSDLDFVVRVDAARFRDHPLMMAIARGQTVHLHDTTITAEGTGAMRLVLPEIEHARLILLGGRLDANGYKGDGVIAVEKGAEDSPTRAWSNDPAWKRLPSNLRRVELLERTSAARDEAALYVLMEGKGLVLATPAELDAVLRVLRDGPDPSRLEPPPRGLLSFAGRVRAGQEPPLPSGQASLRKIIAGLVRYSGSIEADDVLHIEADLVYGSEKEATGAAEVARQVLDRVAILGPAYGSLADSARLAPVGPVLGLRLSVPFALIAGMH